ncbi:MAG: hypothetical protein QOE46_288 [Acidobacteriota bacterium]|jgi:hypothetical protein|nr:hypothetical protein [Acidobacteriota bacterium]
MKKATRDEGEVMKGESVRVYEGLFLIHPSSFIPHRSKGGASWR